MVGRKEELSILEDCLSNTKPEFLAVYGRRRVGKTFLIKEFFNDTFSFYATGVFNCNTRQQLKIFNESLTRYGDNEGKIPKDWFEAFSRLRKILESKDVVKDFRYGKKVVFLDELPWMDTARSDFKSALDYFWNSWGASQKDLLFIVCGSATSWIIKNIVKNNGGLYNRVTRQIHLLPFTLKECEDFFISNGLQLSRKQIIESYMIFGGIPYYLNYLKKDFSLAQNIEKLFFQEEGPLRYEFKQLFSSLFKNSEQYITIIKKLSKVKGGLTRNELLKSKNIVQGKELTKCLEDLVQCGFIRAYQDFTKKKNGCYYQLIDSLTLFHMAFLENSKEDSWLNFVGTPAYYTWSGLAYERVCLLHVKQIKQALGISGIVSNVLSWKSKKTEPGAQIDLIIDRKDDVINLCEIKYSQDEFVIDSAYEKELIHKVETFKSETATKKALWSTMITLSGLKKNIHSGVVIKELTADDLFV